MIDKSKMYLNVDLAHENNAKCVIKTGAGRQMHHVVLNNGIVRRYGKQKFDCRWVQEWFQCMLSTIIVI